MIEVIRIPGGVIVQEDEDKIVLQGSMSVAKAIRQIQSAAQGQGLISTTLLHVVGDRETVTIDWWDGQETAEISREDWVKIREILKTEVRKCESPIRVEAEECGIRVGTEVLTESQAVKLVQQIKVAAKQKGWSV